MEYPDDKMASNAIFLEIQRRTKVRTNAIHLLAVPATQEQPSHRRVRVYALYSSGQCPVVPEKSVDMWLMVLDSFVRLVTVDEGPESPFFSPLCFH